MCITSLSRGRAIYRTPGRYLLKRSLDGLTLAVQLYWRDDLVPLAFQLGTGISQCDCRLKI